MITVLARKTRAALDVLVASAAVRRARRAVATRPVGSLVGRSTATVPDDDPSGMSTEERREGERWGAAVDRALRWTPGDSACLIRAGALHDLLTTHGLPRAEIRIGVRRGPAGFEAHAWVEQDGIPIAEPVSLRGAFSSLDGVTVR
ncbi:MAG: lasso peptide biosynthesis B2 protein [Gemmatimonadaceae bacterium]|nr:lasso peptide biosynthesis B2 protein [Gemmatimonadaceae bacterium]